MKKFNVFLCSLLLAVMLLSGLCFSAAAPDSTRIASVIDSGDFNLTSLAGRDSFIKAISNVISLFDTSEMFISIKEYGGVDFGLYDGTIVLEAPEILAVGKTLSVSASIEGIERGLDCELSWYVDDVKIREFAYTTGRSIPKLSHKFTYERQMPQTTIVKAVLKYTTKGGYEQAITGETEITLENHPKQYWIKKESSAVLKKVTLGYEGDYTLKWAENNDLDDFEKEVWVNAKGYTSKSDYLIWVNLAYQRVNIFQKSDDGWALIHSCIVGTGAQGSGTPPGVWTTSYKQSGGWTTSTYTVKPVVRFRESSGYAFHSRLYYPNTTKIQDASIGYPISRGCVRMYDEDIKFIYDNIPNGTTVVVY